MGFLHIVLPVIVGGVIGYFTNYIAIKMMFHPRKAPDLFRPPRRKVLEFFTFSGAKQFCKV